MAGVPALRAAAILAVFLAGCGEPAMPPPHPALSAVEGPRAYDEPFDAEVPVAAHNACMGVPEVEVCYEGSRSTLYVAGHNESVTGLHLRVDAAPGVAGPIEWEVGCIDPRHLCRGLGSGRDELPFDIGLAGLGLPAASRISLLLRFPHASDPTSVALGFTFRETRAHGTVTVASIPGAALPEVRREGFTASGHSGPCGVAEPGCAQWPGGTGATHSADGGIVVHANVTMAWTSTGPADEELSFTIGCLSGGGCPRHAPVTGRSPLVFDRDVYLPGGITVFVSHPPLLSGDDPATNPAGTRTPVQVVGRLAVEPEPADAE